MLILRSHSHLGSHVFVQHVQSDAGCSQQYILEALAQRVEGCISDLQQKSHHSFV